MLDFSGLEYMNSGGIGLLVTLLVRVQRGGQRLMAAGLTDHYRQIFALTRLDEAIGIHDDEAAALAAAPPDPDRTRRPRRPDHDRDHGSRRRTRRHDRSRRRELGASRSIACGRRRPGAKDDTVTGKRVAGPVQGFGQLWQKTFASASTARTRRRRRSSRSGRRLPRVLAEGQPFSRRWRASPRARSRCSRSAGARRAGQLSTGVMVIYADDESFTFMTPEGHLSAWITFSARRDGDVTDRPGPGARAAGDPFDELAYMLGGNRQNNRFWQAHPAQPGAHSGSPSRPSTMQACASTATASGATRATSVNSATLRSARRTLTAPSAGSGAGGEADAPASGPR